jgi:hypothetical protein
LLWDTFVSGHLTVGEKTSRYIAGSFFTDSANIFKSHVNENARTANGDAQQSTSTLQAAMTAGQRTQWLMLCRPQGVVEVLFSSRDFLASSIMVVPLRPDLDPSQVDVGFLNNSDRIPSDPSSRLIRPACPFSPSGPPTQTSGARHRTNSYFTYRRDGPLALLAGIIISLFIDLSLLLTRPVLIGISPMRSTCYLSSPSRGSQLRTNTADPDEYPCRQVCQNVFTLV